MVAIRAGPVINGTAEETGIGSPWGMLALGLSAEVKSIFMAIRKRIMPDESLTVIF